MQVVATEGFSEPEPNVIESTEGFTVRVLGRVGLEYAEGARTAWIDSEVLAAPHGIAVGMDSMKTWTSPTGPEVVTDEERLRVRQNIERAFTACGYRAKFGPDEEKRDVIEWLRTKRPKA